MQRHILLVLNKINSKSGNSWQILKICSCSISASFVSIPPFLTFGIFSRNFSWISWSIYLFPNYIFILDVGKSFSSFGIRGVYSPYGNAIPRIGEFLSELLDSSSTLSIHCIYCFSQAVESGLAQDPQDFPSSNLHYCFTYVHINLLICRYWNWIIESLFAFARASSDSLFIQLCLRFLRHR